MRTLFILILFWCFSLNLLAQNNLTTEQWQEDLRYLQQKVHNDYGQLFKKVTAKDFDLAVQELSDRIPSLEDHEVMVGFAEIVAMFGYGHTALWLTAWRYQKEVEFHQMPYNLYWFPEGIFVQGVHRDYKEAIGAKVIKVGNKSITEALQAVRPVLSAENDQFFKAHGLHYLGVPEVLHAKEIIDDMDSVTLTLEKDDKQFRVKFKSRESTNFPGHYGLIQQNEEWLDARNQESTPLWLSKLNRKFYYEYLTEEQTVYVRQSEVQDEDDQTISDFYAEVFEFVDQNDVEKLILDLRLNSGGNNYKNKPVITGLIKSEKINQPGKLFVILGRRTFSACQNLVNEIENYTEAIFVGEATAENVNFFGDNRKEILPNSKLSIRLSYLWWQDKDPRDTREWTPPDIAVDLSVKDYLFNKDPVIETILSMDGGGIQDPWSLLVDHFMAGQLDSVTIKAHEFVKDPKYRYYDFEDRINAAGYDLMSVDRLVEATAVLELNAELFPESANCWDSLGEVYWKSGDIEKAISFYNKAVKMDPEGEIGNNARSMLSKMELNKK